MSGLPHFEGAPMQRLQCAVGWRLTSFYTSPLSISQTAVDAADPWPSVCLLQACRRLCRLLAVFCSIARLSTPSNTHILLTRAGPLAQSKVGVNQSL